MDLTDPGFDHTVLSEFRTRLVQGGAAQRLLDVLLEQCQAHGWLKARGRQRTDSTHVLAAVRALNRLECVGESLRHALNVLAEVAQDWLQAYVAQAHPEWTERSSRRIEEYRLPTGATARRAYAEVVGADGWDLLTALQGSSAPAWLREIPALQRLQRIWTQQYHSWETGGHWRQAEELPPAGQAQNSPYDAEACYGKKREITWVGYKAHLTETCDPDTPHLLIQVATTPAAIADETMLPTIQDDLAQHQLLPSTQLVDAGYIDAEALATSRTQFGIDLVGPTRGDYGWQARQRVRDQTGDPTPEPEPFDRSHFVIDWTAQQVICPAGQTSIQWTAAEDRRPRVPRAVINVAFSATHCRTCPSHTRCTTQARRTLTLHPQAHEEALRAARERERTPAFALAYAQRAGVESAHAQGLRLCGLRRSRYVGLAKTHLQHVLTAVALDLVRLSAWLNGTPLAPTRQSTFAQLMVQAA